MEQLKKILENNKEHTLYITYLHIENKHLKDKVEYLLQEVERLRKLSDI